MSLFLISLGSPEASEVERILRNGGYNELKTSHSMVEALAHLGIGGPGSTSSVYGVDTILLMSTSDSESIDSIRKIRQNFQYQDLPIIVISDHPSPESLQMAFAFGATDFIDAPVKEAEVIARVRSALRLKHETDRRKARERELMEATRQLSDVNSLLTRLSLIDSLTNVANRMCFDKSFDQEWRRAFRSGSYLSVAMIDVDYFKLYNDNYGHMAGDEALRSVARHLKENLRRAGDFIARYGGEEFVTVLPETPPDGAQRVCENLRAAVELAAVPHLHRASPHIITVSIGVATCIPQVEASPNLLIKAADEALYKAKGMGRNAVHSVTLDLKEMGSKVG